MDPEALTLAVRRRARAEQCRILPAYLGAVADGTGAVMGGLSAASIVGADIVGMDLAELYCDGDTREDLFARFAITATSSRPNLIVRTIEDTALAHQLLTGRISMPAAAVAVDLIESSDPRTKHAGTVLAAELLDGFDHG